MSNRRLQFRMSEGVWINVDDVQNRPIQSHQQIYIEKAEFQHIMSINMVAVALGKSVRHVRRMIESGEFPPSNLRKGQSQFWARQTVRAWKKAQLRSSTKRCSSRMAARGHWNDADQIEIEEERESLRKGTDTQKLMADVLDMNVMLGSNRIEFARRHPNLKEWLKDFPKQGGPDVRLRKPRA